MASLKLTEGRWNITTIYGDYVVDVQEISDYKGGAVSGPYTCHGNYIGIGTFPLIDISRMVKV